MSKPQVKEILDRVLTWSSDRQEDAARLLMLMETQDQAGYGLTEEQAKEVERRLLDTDAPHLTLDEFNERLGRLLNE